MGFKSGLRAFCKKNAVLSRQYDKLTWYKSKLQTLLISDEAYAKSHYKKATGKELHLDNPQTFDEKLWYLKLHNRDPLLTICSDKYRVREYVKQCGYREILNELYGVYDDARDIPFDSFTEPVFLKCNHGSGENIIYYPDKPFDREDFIKRFNFLLKQNSYTKSREWNYKNILPKIVAERVLRDKNGNLPLDYKFLCFHGEPKLMYWSKGGCAENGTHQIVSKRYLNTYDMDFQLTEIDEGFPINYEDVEKPNGFEMMKEMARVLSKPFIHARVDFMVCDDDIYLSEITFYDGGGCNGIKPAEWDYRIGSWIDLTKVKETI